MPANVFFKFFIVSSPSGPSSVSSFLVSSLSLGSSGTFFTADVALLVAETELVSSEAEKLKKKIIRKQNFQLLFFRQNETYKAVINS